MPDSLNVDYFLGGSYESPYFTQNFPGPFAPPPRCPNLCVLTGNAVALDVVAPAAGGTLTLMVSQRGDPTVNLLAADGGVPHTLTAATGTAALTVDNVLCAADLTGVAAGTAVEFTLAGFSGAVPPDTYCFVFTQAVGGVATVVGQGSFDVQAVGF